MFSSRVFRVGPSDAFHVVFEYGDTETAPRAAHSTTPRREKIRLPVSHARLELDWTSSESETAVLERFVQQQSRLLEQHRQERVVLQLDWEPIPCAASFPNQRLNVRLKVASSPPVLRSIHFSRTSGSSSASDALVSALLKHVDLSGVWKLRGCEGLGHFWATCTDSPTEWSAIKNLNLSSCGLTAVPASIGQLSSLHALRLNHNKLTSLPAEIGQLIELEVLSVNHNALSTLPVELRRCCNLRELHVEHNRLVTPLLDLTHATALVSLQLYGNPLDYLPELGPAVGLRSLSLANVRILADAAYSRWEVEVTAPSSSYSYSSYTSMVIGARGHKLQPLFNLVFRRSNVQHPLLMGALSRLIEDPANLELLVREDVALQQLVLASMGNNSLVVEQAVKVMAAAGSYAGAARRLVKHNVVDAFTHLVVSKDVSMQLSGLRLLSALSAGAAEGEVSGDVLVPTQLLDRLLHLIRDPRTNTEVRCAALHALGNSAFDAHNRRRYLQSPGLMQLLVKLAASQEASQGMQDAAAGAKPETDNPPAPHCSSHLRERELQSRDAAAEHKAGHNQRSTLRQATQADASGQGVGAAAADSSIATGSDTAAASPAENVKGQVLQDSQLSSGRQQLTAQPSSEPAAPVATEAADTTPTEAEAADQSSQPATAGAQVATKQAASISPPVLSMHRVASVQHRVPSGQVTGVADAPADTNVSADVGRCRTADDSSTAAAAAAGLTAVAEAVTAAGSYALAAATTTTAAVGISSGRSDEAMPGGSKERGSGGGVVAFPASGALAAAAGAAAAVAAAPQAGPVSDTDGTTAPASAADAVLFPKRKKLVHVNDAVKLQAIRLLAVLGQNEQVRIALGAPPIRGRGLRVLAMDGGGMKGMAMVELLRQLERRAGAPIWTLFDVIGGTSTGGLLAVAAGILRLTLDECQDIYTKLGNKVFHSSVAQEEAGWRESLYRMYATGSANMRVAVYGAKHDAAPYEELLRKFCAVQELGCASDRLIDTAVLGGPKVFVVATLASTRPAAPFAFRNYELPEEAGPAAAALAACAGSCKHHVWEAVRASSAAPYYLDDFVTPDGKRFQDGATTANNPAAVALAQARLLHPQLPVDVLVSLGCGSEPAAERSKGLSAVIDTGAVLLESACSVDRVHEALAATLPLVPGCQYYRFNAVDARCAMELDDIKPESWRKLFAATSEYCSRPEIAAQFDQLAELLTEGQACDQLAARQQYPAKQPLRWDTGQILGTSAGAGGVPSHWQQQQEAGASSRDNRPSADVQAISAVADNLGDHTSSQGLGISQQGLGIRISNPEHSGKRQKTAADAAAAGGAAGAAAHAGKAAAGTRAGLGAPKLLYQKGVLLVEAPRNLAASAVAAAGAAGAAALVCVRQQQQQELVGQMLASVLPHKWLQVCNLSTATGSSVAAAAAGSRDNELSDVSLTPSPVKLPTQQQQEAAATVAVEPRHVEQLLQSSNVAEPRRSAGGSSPAAASPKTASWFEYIFPWQSSSGSEQQGEGAAAAAAAGSGQTAARSEAGPAASGDDGVDSVRLPDSAGGSPATKSEPQPSTIAASGTSLEKQQPLSAALPGSRTFGSNSTASLPEQQQQHLQHPNSPGGRHSSSKTQTSRSPLGRKQHRVQQQPHSPSALQEPLVSIDWPGSSSHSMPAQQQQHQQQPAGVNVVTAALRAALSAAAGRVGVLHLALHSTEGGLVGGWSQEVTAVVEPGAGADELLSLLRADPSSTSLAQLVASQGPLLPTPGGGMVAVLGQQAVLAPAPLTSFASHTAASSSMHGYISVQQPVHQHLLTGSSISSSSAFLTSWVLQLTQPDAQRLLEVNDIFPLLSQLQQLIVVSSSWLPDGVVHVLLRGGVAAVVGAADAGAVQRLDASDVAEFFMHFYEGLVRAGLDVLEALQSAAVAVPRVGPGVYQCYQL